MTPRSTPLLATALATALLAACAPESSTSAARQADATADALVHGVVDAAGQAALASAGQEAGKLQAQLAAARDGAAIAAYPNRGDLVGYDHVRRPEKRGAHTFHPVRVSEEHALDAIGSGTLFLTAPDGSRIALQYERHVEHPSGDWSWIGRDENGIEGILTFGEKAVFGVVPHGDGDTLRLTTNAGQTWMAATDRSVLSPMQQRINAGLTGPDFRIPRLDDDAVAASGLVTEAMASAAAKSARAEGAPAQAATGGTTIDVLLGYTPGFVSMMGGASQAQTRLNHIITVGNQAMSNSSVAVNLRLVATLQVNHTDSGSNQTALEQLTGSNGQSNVTVPASLQPLRNARETHGADLVALVRRFRDADHEGCGIAWLIGGDQTPITQPYEKFGYSVISDSNGMQSPDNGHYCRDETLVHELGHNMGSQHDKEAATDDKGQLGYGRYPYSFGYKTNSANGNFHTVMAYGDVGQTAYRIFSNPQSTYCGGRACGIANEADNARSLRQTAPLIAAFRATAHPLETATLAVGSTFDANGDGRADILWRHDGNGNNAIWLSANVATTQAVARVPSTQWRIVGAGDFNGDGRSDILWRHSVSGQNTIWLSGNSATTQAVATVADQRWSVAAVGDFNGDGRDDIVWRHSESGANALWHSANVGTSTTLAAVTDQRWELVAVGDFNGDGRSDLVWRHNATGNNTLWLSGNAGNSQTLVRVPDTRWFIAAAGDFDADGRSDLVWRHAGSGINSVWRQGNGASSYALARVADNRWSIQAAGDYTGDGRADLLWRHSGNGGNSVWRSASANSSLAVATVPDIAWDVKP